MNLLKKIISGSPLDEYRKLNAEIEALDKFITPLHAARLERETDLAKARAAFASQK